MRRFHLSTAALVTVALFALASSFTSAGPLSPPAGPVASTPGPEPRIAINAQNTPGEVDSVFTISQPGSYYLTGSVLGAAGKHGIKITISDVTIDLNGFTLTGVPGSLDGIHAAAGAEVITIQRGVVRNWGGDGVDLLNVTESHITSVRSRQNGNNGFSCGAAPTLENCSATENGGIGLATLDFAVINRSTFSQNTGKGAALGSYATISNSTFNNNGETGLATGAGAKVQDSQVQLNGLQGASLGNKSSVTDSSLSDNQFDGLFIGSDCTITDVNVNNNGLFGPFTGSGIQAGAGCSVSQATANSNSSGGIILGPQSNVTSCVTNLNGNSGVFTADDTTISSCTAIGNTGNGANVGNRCTVNGGVFNNNTTNGINVFGTGSVVQNTEAGGNTAAGILLTGQKVRCDSNHITGNARGIETFNNGRHIIVRNSADMNTVNYQVGTGSPLFAPVVSDFSAAGPWSNFEALLP